MPDLLFPFGGRSDHSAFEAQPGLTTRKAENVRGRDPVTGRVRGAQRAGMTKFNSTAIASTKIREMCSLVVDNRKVNYAVRDRNLITESEDFTTWSTNGTGAVTLSSTEVAPDGSSTVYLLNDNDGAATFQVYEDIGSLSNTEDYTFSCYLKEDTALVSGVWIEHTAGTKSISVDYTWATGSVAISISGGGTGSGRAIPSIRGFVRIEATLEYDSGDAATLRPLVVGSVGVATTDQSFAWGAQFEQASTASAYHPVDPQREWGWPT